MSSSCRRSPASAVVALDIASKTGAATFTHPYGCTFDAIENTVTEDTFIGHGRHPNVGAVLIVSLGCETASAARVAEAIRDTGKPVEVLVVQKAGRGALQQREGHRDRHPPAA